MVRILMVVVAAALGADVASGSAPDASGGGWRCERMDVVIDLTRASENRARIEGEMRVVLEIESSLGPSIGVNSRAPVMSFAEAEGPAGSTVELNARSPMSPASRLVHVRSESASARGDAVTLGFTLESEGESFQWMVGERIALASWTEAWLPGMTPAPGTMPGVGNVHSAGRTTFLLPRGWGAITNGRLVERVETETGVTEVWETEQRVARSFAAGPFESAWHDVNGRRIGVYLLSEKPLGVQKQVEMLAGALEAQEARFGPYPYPTYAIVEVPDDAVRWYASSEQGFIMAKSSAFAFEHGNLPLWAHEMAHGWWGNLVGTDGPGSILCSESLAQYSAVIAIEALEGADAATKFLRFSRHGYVPIQCARGYFGILNTGNDMALSQITSQHQWGHHLSDAKGHWVFHMLRGRVGDEVFFATLRTLIDRFAGSDMRLDDVRAAFIESAPDADLEVFFAQWLDRPGAPVLDATLSDGALVITQAQAGEPYALRVDVALELDDGSHVRRSVEVRERETRTPIDVARPVVAVHVDPDHRLLIWTPEYGERPKAP